MGPAPTSVLGNSVDGVHTHTHTEKEKIVSVLWSKKEVLKLLERNLAEIALTAENVVHKSDAGHACCGLT